MNSITAVLEPDSDGTVHLPLPLDLRNSRVRVTATLEVASEDVERPSLEEVKAALKRLRERGTFRGIDDPVAWQREIRKDVGCRGGRDETAGQQHRHCACVKRA